MFIFLREVITLLKSNLTVKKCLIFIYIYMQFFTYLVRVFVLTKDNTSIVRLLLYTEQVYNVRI